MKQFKDLGIPPPVILQSFVGDKITIQKVLNRMITVHDYKIDPSKFKDRCLCMQIIYNDQKRIIFTGAKGLIIAIEQIPKADLPFTTTIVEGDNERLEFT